MNLLKWCPAIINSWSTCWYLLWKFAGVLVKRFPVSMNWIEKIRISCFSLHAWNYSHFDSFTSKSWSNVLPFWTWKVIWMLINYRNKPGSSEIILPSGSILDRSQASRLLGDWFNSLESFSQRFNQIDIDISAFACLSGLSLISGKYHFHFSLLYAQPSLYHWRNAQAIPKYD